MFKPKKLYRLFYLSPLIYLFFSLLFFVVLIVDLVWFFSFNENNVNLIVLFAVLFVFSDYLFFLINKYYRIIASHFGSTYILNFLNKQKRILLFSIVYYCKNRNEIILEYNNLFSCLDLNTFFSTNNEFVNRVMYVKKLMTNIKLILVSGAIIGVFCFTLMSNNLINTNLSISICYILFFCVPILIVYLACWIYQVVISYHLWKKSFVNKKVFLSSCVPIVNLFSFAFL